MEVGANHARQHSPKAHLNGHIVTSYVSRSEMTTVRPLWKEWSSKRLNPMYTQLSTTQQRGSCKMACLPPEMLLSVRLVMVMVHGDEIRVLLLR